ncbi:hypothetical protein [Embleya sp. NBC_00896]|uniref:hypothetical protein n=1 Tax=Embleya sp. NBC_00896 TaxID=2975961 RepID=UPI0038683C04|nr:hypothetical protein OG928_31795 [Embleya sp. NBC_00896]
MSEHDPQDARDAHRAIERTAVHAGPSRRERTRDDRRSMAASTPTSASAGRARFRGLAVIACALTVLTTSTACGGDDKKKDASAPPPSSGPQTPGSVPSAANGTPPAAVPTSPTASPTKRPCVNITATGKPERGKLSREDLRSAVTDPKPLTADEVLGLAEVSYKYPGGTLTRTCVKVLEGDCGPIALDETSEQVKKLGCRRAIGALYVDKANNVQTTVGVLEMPTATAAATLSVDYAGGYNQVSPPADSGAKLFAPDAAYTAGGQSLYRYFIYEMTGRADGTDRDPAEVDKHNAASNAIYHLVGDSLDRRAAGAP